MSSPFIQWGFAALTLPGQSDSGDRCVVRVLPTGILVAVVDGLGHGDEAADAAERAIATLEANGGESVITLIRRCHEGLRGTRGAVVTVAWLNPREGTMTWLGVGNVEGRLLRADPRTSPHVEFLLLRGGVVGVMLPQLIATILSMTKGDTLILATDGVQIPIHQEVSVSDPAEEIARRILSTHAKGTDDALVLVARCIGQGP